MRKHGQEFNERRPLEAVFIVSVEQGEDGGTYTRSRWVGDVDAQEQGKRIIVQDVLRDKGVISI